MVTVLYELITVGADLETATQQEGTDPLKYQAEGVQGSGFRVQKNDGSADFRLPNPDSRVTDPAKSGELLTLKLRYKEPDGETSKLLEYPLKDRGHSFHSASPDFQFAAAVASFGMILRGSQHRGNATLDAVAEIASGAMGKDE